MEEANEDSDDQSGSPSDNRSSDDEVGDLDVDNTAQTSHSELFHFSSSPHQQLLEAIHTGNEIEQNRISERIRQGLDTQGDKDVNNLVLQSAQTADLTVLKFLLDRHGTHCLTVTDSDNDTLVHLAALRQESRSAKEAMQLLTAAFGMQCLAVEGNTRRTAIHCAALNTQTPDVLLWLIDNVDDAQLFFTNDAENDTAVHMAFMLQNESTVKRMTDKLGMQKCLAVEGFSRRTAIHCAALKTQTPDVLMWLIDNVDDAQPFFTKDAQDHTAVHYAFRYQTVSTVKHLTDKLGLQNCLAVEGNTRRTAVHCAAFNEKAPDVLLWLIDNVDDAQPFFTKDAQDNTAVHYAFRSQTVSTVKHLTDKLGLQKCLAVEDISGCTAVHCAVLNEKTPDVLLWLIDNVEDAQPCFIAVHYAFRYQTVSTVKHLTDKLGLQKCLAVEDNFRRTAVHYAALNTQTPDVLLWLIDNVEDAQPFFTKDGRGNTAVHLAFECQNESTVKRLTDKLGLQKCLAVEDNSRCTAVHCAALNEKTPDVLLWLIDNVEDALPFFTKDAEDNTAVHMAFGCQTVSTVKHLTDKLGLQKCIAVEGNTRRTAVHIAALNTQTPDVLLWLLDNVDDAQPFFTKDAQNNTAVHMAFEFQNESTLKRLTDKLGL